METAKEKAIREAYGEHWDKFNESAKKCALKNEGYISNLLEHTPNNIDLEQGDRMFRPKSLQGIETNNGWTRIESEADLPPNGHYWVIDKDGKMSDCPRINDSFIDDTEHWLKDFTHWQPIIKPQPPIY